MRGATGIAFWTLVLVLGGCAASGPARPSGVVGVPVAGTPSTVPGPTEAGRPGLSGETCDELATEFAVELSGRIEWATSAGGSAPALADRLRETIESLAGITVDHVFTAGLGGECLYADFAETLSPMLSGDLLAAIETSGYPMFERLSLLMSAMEIEERVERLPPVPVRPVPEFGDGPWGPLAVVEAEADSGDLAAFGGLLRVDAECVSVSGATMIFRSAQVRWNVDRESITFWDPLGDVAIELRHGDHVRFGGGEYGLGESANWANEPDPSCSLDGAFGVHSLSEVNGVPIRELGPAGG